MNMAAISAEARADGQVLTHVLNFGTIVAFFGIQVKDNTQNSKLFDFRYSLRVGHADQLR